MIDPAMRDRTACQYRIRNEGRWIRRSLERTFQVARSVVLWDDGSEDDTLEKAMLSILPPDPERIARFLAMPSPFVVEYNDCALHILRSPFRYHVVRPREAVNEQRDKNVLLHYCKSSVDFDFMICLDGDEVLSLDAIRKFPEAIATLSSGTVDILSIPFLYLWGSETQRRRDGLYGDDPDGYPKLRFPRVYTILRLSASDQFDQHFKWSGTGGGFHGGSVAREGFQNRIDGTPVRGGFAPLLVQHYGYIDNDLRQRKVAFYRSIDPLGSPSNTFEDNYAHCLGEPDRHAPGPLEFVPWKDA